MWPQYKKSSLDRICLLALCLFAKVFKSLILYNFATEPMAKLSLDNSLSPPQGELPR